MPSTNAVIRRSARISSRHIDDGQRLPHGATVSHGSVSEGAQGLTAAGFLAESTTVSRQGRALQPSSRWAFTDVALRRCPSSGTTSPTSVLKRPTSRTSQSGSARVGTFGSSGPAAHGSNPERCRASTPRSRTMRCSAARLRPGRSWVGRWRSATSRTSMTPNQRLGVAGGEPSSNRRIRSRDDAFGSSAARRSPSGSRSPAPASHLDGDEVPGRSLGQSLRADVQTHVRRLEIRPARLVEGLGCAGCP